MLSVDAADAASTTRSTTVTNRVCLWSDGIVRTRIPQSAKIGAYENGDTCILFLMFPLNVQGGRVNCFAHINTHLSRDALASKTIITAQLHVMKKTLEDGREYLYLDFIPVESSTPVTHKVVTASRAGQYQLKPDWVVFETPPPLSSWVVITPPGVKVGGPSNGEVVVPKSKTPAKAAVASTGDPVLDRLTQQEGWSIVGETERTITLSKWKGGVRKFLDHPKKKRA